MRRAAQAGAWLVVVVLATSLTWQIVSAADDRITAQPSPPLNVAAPEFRTAVPSTSTTLAPTPTTTTGESVSSSAVTTTTAVVTTTSQVETTSTTENGWSIKTTNTEGGAVTVKYRPGEVVFQTASPAIGFRVEVEKAGPPEVEVKFENASNEIEFHAKWESGELKIEISGSDDH